MLPSLFDKVFTKEEFFYFWLPIMLLGAGVIAYQVTSGIYDFFTGVLYEVILGVLMYAVAKRVNPRKVSASYKEKSAGERDGQ